MSIPLNKRTPSEWIVNPAVQSAVDKMIKDDPVKYNLAQNFGEFLMDTPFSTLDTIEIPQDDVRGERVRVNTILNNIKQYGLALNELSHEELLLLNRVLGSSWHELLNIN